MKKAYIPQWGQYVSTTPQGDVRVKMDFAASGNRMTLSVRNTIYDAAGKIVAKSKGDHVTETEGEESASLGHRKGISLYRQE